MSSWTDSLNPSSEVIKSKKLGVTTTKKELEQLYIEKNLTLSEVGEELGVSPSTARRFVDEAGIELRDFTDKYENEKYRDKSWLKQKYLKENKSSREIGSICGVHESTIQFWLSKFAIQKNSGCEKYKEEDWLKKEYLDKDRRIKDISAECDVTIKTIKNWLNKFDIKKRETPVCCRFNFARYKSTDGYPTWSATGCGNDPGYLTVHRLVAIADGADPYKVFSDKNYQVHHRNGFKCDNRPANLELIDRRSHGQHHSPDAYKWKDDDIEFVMKAMINPSKYLDI